MADVWISRKRWTCKYCQVTINDDPPSRRHHESGMRHKHNVERALRALHRDTDAQRRAEQEKQRTMQQIEQAARRQHAKYDAGHSSRPTSAAPPLSAAPSKPAPAPARRPAAWTPSDKMAHYTTADALGLQEDAPTYVPPAASLTAEIGAWETVTPRAPNPAPSEPAPVHDERQAARDFALVERSLDDDDDTDLGPIITKRQRAGDSAVSVKSKPDTHTPPTEGQDAVASADEPASRSLFRKRKARGPLKSVGVSGPP